jgi:hypothetical protein
MIGRGQLAGPCPSLLIKMDFLNEKATSDVVKKQLLMTSEVAFSLKHYFLIKNSLLGAGNLAPSYHCSFTIWQSSH